MIALLGLSASTALAAAPEGAQKAPLFGPNYTVSGFDCSTGAFPTPKTFGFVVLNTPGNEMTVTGEVALKRAAKNTAYEVIDVQDIGGFCFNFVVGTITTNNKGNGNLHFAVERLTGSTEFWVALWNVPGEEFLGNSAVELD
jgi:hypothetical protein